MKFLKHIHKTSLSVNKSLDPSITHQMIVSAASEIAGADFGSIYLRTGKETLRRAYTNIPKKHRIRSRDKGNTYKAFNQQKQVFISKSKLQSIHPESKDKQIQNIWIIPMILDQEPLGVITLSALTQMKSDKETKEKLQILASMAGMAIHNSYLFQQMQGRLEERDMFISMAAHELKTPLTSISGYAQLSLSKLKKNKPVQERHLEGIVTQVERLNQTITDFLSVDNVRKGKLPFSFSEVSVFDVVESSISAFKTLYPQHKIDLHLQPLFDMDDTWVWGDFHKLSQAITNILNNAGKYSPEKSTIYVTSNEGPDSVEITIRDEGPGIDESEHHKIFDLFYRTGETEEAGKGIGLFLAKQIVTNHQGAIEVLTSDSTGTTFRIVLPTVQEK